MALFNAKTVYKLYPWHFGDLPVTFWLKRRSAQLTRSIPPYQTTILFTDTWHSTFTHWAGSHQCCASHVKWQGQVWIHEIQDKVWNLQLKCKIRRLSHNHNFIQPSFSFLLSFFTFFPLCIISFIRIAPFPGLMPFFYILTKILILLVFFLQFSAVIGALVTAPFTTFFKSQDMWFTFIFSMCLTPKHAQYQTLL